jgi:hypothetical protein
MATSMSTAKGMTTRTTIMGMGTVMGTAPGRGAWRRSGGRTGAGSSSR